MNENKEYELDFDEDDIYADDTGETGNVGKDTDYDEDDLYAEEKPKLTRNQIMGIAAGAVVLILLFVLGIRMLADNSVTPTGDTETSTTTVVEEVPVTTTEGTTESFVTTAAPVYLPTDVEVEYYASDRNTWSMFNGVVGEINIPRLGIKRLVFQGLFDNEEFLYVNEFGEEDINGCIFGDYRNNFNILDANNVIYGHNMKDGTMFAPLLNLRDTAFFEDDSEVLIYFNSEGYNNIFKVYSVYEIDLTTFNFIQTGFADEQAKQDFIDKSQSLNIADALIFEDVPLDAKLITLSTCTNYGKNRFVVHGYLVNRDVV